MLTPDDIVKYGIIGTWDRYSAVDDLFSNSEHDPYLCALMEAEYTAAGHKFDISVALGPKGKCVTQIIVFRSKEGYERYVRDGITIFDHKEI